MRDYGKVAATYYIGATGRKIRALGAEVQLLGLYLLTGPNASMYGIYYLPLPLIFHHLNIPSEGALKGLASLSEVGFCHYDEPSEEVFVPEMAKYQIGDSLAASDNRHKGLVKELKILRKSVFYPQFYHRYKTDFNLPSSAKPASPLQAPCKPLASQEQEQDQEEEQEEERESPTPFLDQNTTTSSSIAPASKPNQRTPDGFHSHDIDGTTEEVRREMEKFSGAIGKAKELLFGPIERSNLSNCLASPGISRLDVLLVWKFILVSEHTRAEFLRNAGCATAKFALDPKNFFELLTFAKSDDGFKTPRPTKPKNGKYNDVDHAHESEKQLAATRKHLREEHEREKKILAENAAIAKANATGV